MTTIPNIVWLRDIVPGIKPASEGEAETFDFVRMELESLISKYVAHLHEQGIPVEVAKQQATNIVAHQAVTLQRQQSPSAYEEMLMALYLFDPALERGRALHLNKIMVVRNEMLKYTRKAGRKGFIVGSILSAIVTGILLM